MKKFFALLAVTFLLASCVAEADAAMRFGGGRSFGRSTSSLFQKAPAPKPGLAGQTAPGASKVAPGATKQNASASASAKTAAPAATARPMGGMLMGIATFFGIAALVSALGLSAGFAQVLTALAIGLLIYFGLRFVAGRFLASRVSETQRQQTRNWQETADHGQTRPGSAMDSFSSAGIESLSIPAGFDAKGFESEARKNFIRLQKAWDKADVISVADFMTNDFFIALTHELRNHGTQVQTSEIVNLTVRLLGVVHEKSEYAAVVSFNGAVKINGQFEQVSERWLLIRADDESTGWLLAGIEQV
ncbi:MAG TPA: hypothetical protein DD376_04160 [Sutterella sp.]|nr:hypothetical protein [Sutterella sp.]